MKACEPVERGECYRQTCVDPDEASDLAVWGRGHAGCWAECGLSQQGSWEHWSWESCSGMSCHLKYISTKHPKDIRG